MGRESDACNHGRALHLRQSAVDTWGFSDTVRASQIPIMAKKYVYHFSGKNADGNGKMKLLLGDG